MRKGWERVDWAGCRGGKEEGVMLASGDCRATDGDFSPSFTTRSGEEAFASLASFLEGVL